MSLDIASQNGDVLFVSSLGDGIYKSDDKGESWQQINSGLTTLAIDLIEISAASPETVFAGGLEGGLYKTEDGGASWRSVIDAGTAKVTAVAFSPTNSNHIIAGSENGGLYFSDNGGETWRRYFEFVDNGAIKSIEFSPSSASETTYFVGTEISGAYRGTFDKSGRKEPLSELSNILPDQSVMSIEIVLGTEKGPNIIASTWNNGVFYSEDDGETWQNYSEGLTKTLRLTRKIFDDPILKIYEFQIRLLKTRQSTWADLMAYLNQRMLGKLGRSSAQYRQEL